MKSKYSTFNSVPYETHRLVYEGIAPDSTVLDIGCATGYFARELNKKTCRIWGMDSDRIALTQAKKYCRKTFFCDLEKIKSIPFGMKFDYILLLDVIEHLHSPENILTLSQKYLKKDGRIIISTPNIAFISIRLALLFGRFRYRNLGIMDEKHIHFYTKSSLIGLLQKSGLRIEKLDAASGFSQITRIGKYLNMIPKYWQYRITKIWDTLLGYQFIAFCKS